MSLISAPGNVLTKTMLMKSLPEVLWCTHTMFLSKQVLTTVTGRGRDAYTTEVPGAYTLLRCFSTTRNTPWGKEALGMADAFLGIMLPL